MLLITHAAMAAPSRHSMHLFSRWAMSMAGNIIWLFLAAFLIPITRSGSSVAAATFELIFGVVSLALGGYLLVQLLDSDLTDGFGSAAMWVSISLGIAILQLWVGYKAVRHSRSRSSGDDE